MAALLLCGALCPRDARAACPNQNVDPSNDLSLECLVDAKDSSPQAPPNSAVPTAQEASNYRSLISELSGVFALPMAQPADTVGFSGFHFSFDTNLTTINRNASYWSGPSAGVRNVTSGVLPVLSIMLRKGVWMPLPPLPSVELGIGASNLLNSGLYAVNGYVKLAIHEGYHDVWVPSFAVRGGITRLVGASQLDLTIITADAVISKAFGVGGTFTLEPFIGGGAFFSIARSQVIDVQPEVDLYRGPVGQPFDENARRDALAQKIVFPTQKDIIRWRVFAGIHFHYSILAITAGYTLLGSGLDAGIDLSSLDPTAAPKDVSAFQHQVNLSAGLRF